MFSIVALFVRPFSGIISDRISKKRVFIAATALIGFSLIGYGLSTGIASLVVFSHIPCSGIFRQRYGQPCAGGTDHPEKKDGRRHRYFGLGHIIATASGPALGLYIEERYGLSAVFLIAGIDNAFCVSHDVHAPIYRTKKEKSRNQ